jgi:transposase-like protein
MNEHPKRTSETGAQGSAPKRRRQRRDASQWQVLIEQQRTSGLAIKRFCAEHGVGEASFYAWRRHLRRTPPLQSNDVEKFVRLEPRQAAVSDALEVRFTCGTTLRCSSAHLADLVGLLRSERDEAGPC